MADLTKGSEHKVILKFISPILIGSMLQQGFHIADRIIVGHFLGTSALAAVGSSAQIMNFLIAIAMGFTVGATILIARYTGERDRENLRKSISTTYLAVIVVSLIITVCGITWAENFLALINTSPEIIADSAKYLRIIFLGTISIFGFSTTVAILRGMGDSKTPLLFLIYSVILNIVLDVYFIRNLGWGVSGAAWASVIAQTVAFTHGLIRTKFRPKFKLDKGKLEDILHLGIPSGIQKASSAAGQLFIQSLVNSFGVAATAGFVSATAIENLIFSPILEFSVVSSTFTAQNLGAKNKPRIKRGLWATVLIATAITACVTAVILIFTRPLLELFIKESPESMEHGLSYLRTVAPFYVLAAAQFTMTGLFRGAGITWLSMMLTVIATLGIRLPVAYFFSRIWGSAGIWWASPIAWVFGLLASFGYYYFRFRKKYL